MLAHLILYHFSALSPPLQFPTKSSCSTFPFLSREMLLYGKISASSLACTWQEQGTAVKSPSLISSSPLTQVGVLLPCSSLKPRGRGLAQFGAQLFPFRLGLPQRLSFRYSQGEIK